MRHQHSCGTFHRGLTVTYRNPLRARPQWKPLRDPRCLLFLSHLPVLSLSSLTAWCQMVSSPLSSTQLTHFVASQTQWVYFFHPVGWVSLWTTCYHWPEWYSPFRDPNVAPSHPGSPDLSLQVPGHQHLGSHKEGMEVPTCSWTQPMQLLCTRHCLWAQRQWARWEGSQRDSKYSNDM